MKDTYHVVYSITSCAAGSYERAVVGGGRRISLSEFRELRG